MGIYDRERFYPGAWARMRYDRTKIVRLIERHSRSGEWLCAITNTGTGKCVYKQELSESVLILIDENTEPMLYLTLQALVK